MRRENIVPATLVERVNDRRFTVSIGSTIPSGFHIVCNRVLIVSSSNVVCYVSLSHLRSMNGQTQSGGHWKATLGLMAGGSVFLGSSGSGKESNIGSLLIMCDTPLKKSSDASTPL